MSTGSARPPDLLLASWDAAWPEVDDENALLVEQLARAGVRAEVRHWRSDEPREGDPPRLIRSTHDYPEHLEEFDDWMTRSEAVAPLWNPAHLVRWNRDKRYLLELAERGVSLPPTLAVARGDAAGIADFAEEHGATGLVAKPAVGLGGLGIVRLPRGTSALAQLEELARATSLLVQPFLPSIEAEGEMSLVYAKGELSHALRKLPKDGDFRVQARHGGTSVPATASPAEDALARQVLAALPEVPLQARVDMVTDLTGSPALMELELIEPLLFLRHAPDGGARLAHAIARQVREAPLS